VEVIFPQKFGVDFWNAVYRFRTLNCYIRGWISGRFWSKCPYRTRNKQLKLVLLCQFYHVVYTCRQQRHLQSELCSV
jgi:hypothetical protein